MFGAYDPETARQGWGKERRTGRSNGGCRTRDRNGHDILRTLLRGAGDSGRTQRQDASSGVCEVRNEQLVRAKRERLKRARIRDCGDSVRWPERAVSFVRKHTDPDVPVSSNCDHHKVFDKKA